jgi:hypothetical protein
VQHVKFIHSYDSKGWKGCLRDTLIDNACSGHLGFNCVKCFLVL